MTARPAPNPLHLLAEALPRYSDATLRVARVILDDPDAAGRASISALAARAAASPATVTRLAASLGFAGFPELRAAIATENGRGAQAGWESEIGADIAVTDGPREVLAALARRQFEALRAAEARLDLERVADVADRIAAARRVHLYGEWGDAVPTQELAMRLLRIGIPAWFHDGEQSARVALGLLAAGDVAVVVARGDGHAAAARFLGDARRVGAFAALVTGAPDSAAARAADAVLYTGTPEGEHWLDFFAGRASDTLVTSLLWVLVAQRLPDPVAAVRRGTTPIEE